MNNKPIIKKIEFSKEEQEEIENIKKGQAVPKTKIVTNKKSGYSYEYTTNKKFSFLVGRKRLLQLYTGICSSCGQWPDYKIMVDVGDERQGAWLVSRYCQKCYDRQNYKNLT